MDEDEERPFIQQQNKYADKSNDTGIKMRKIQEPKNKPKKDEMANFVDTVFSNMKLKSFYDIVETAKEFKITPWKAISGFWMSTFFGFNIWVMVSNFIWIKPEKWEPKTISLDNAQFIIFSAELFFMVLLVLKLILHIIVSVTWHRDVIYQGKNGRRISYAIITIINFSLIRLTPWIKTIFMTIITVWTREVTFADKEHKCKGRLFCFGEILGRFSLTLISLVAFLLKTTQLRFIRRKSLNEYNLADMVTFFGYMNHMISMYNPYIISMDTIYRFLFAGNDCILSKNETKVMNEFKEIIFYNIMEGRPFQGIIIIVTMDRYDLHKLLLADVKDDKLLLVDVDDDMSFSS